MSHFFDMKKEILNVDKIHLLVDNFYDLLSKDQLLFPIFNEIIQDKWPELLNKACRFLQSVLLSVHSYMGSLFLPHTNVAGEKNHFESCLALFNMTIDKNFKVEKAEKAKWRVAKMFNMSLYKIQYYINSPQKNAL